jgi:hypothetical protein
MNNDDNFSKMHILKYHKFAFWGVSMAGQNLAKTVPCSLNNTMYQQVFPGLNHKYMYIWNDTQMDREINRQLLLFVKLTCSVRICHCIVQSVNQHKSDPRMHTDIIPFLSPRRTASEKKSLMINLLHFKCWNVSRVNVLLTFLC